jgi:hypothetical protein
MVAAKAMRLRRHEQRRILSDWLWWTVRMVPRSDLPRGLLLTPLPGFGYAFQDAMRGRSEYSTSSTHQHDRP